MISASPALFQTATKGIGAVTASAVIVNFFLKLANIIQAPAEMNVALADLTTTFFTLRSCRLKKSC